MELDKSRVYTAVNADELKIGSRCIFANTILSLREEVESLKGGEFIGELIAILDDNLVNRLRGEKGAYPLAYLIEPPAEPKYKPFESLNSLSNAVKRHRDNIQTKESKFLANIIGISLSNEIIINDLYGLCILPADELLNDYVFADDGSPCGELVEE